MELAAETERIVSQFDFDDGQVNDAVKEFLNQMSEGLQKDGTSLSQIPTYVTAVPNGTEKGLYMAVDLGGTNFRVCSVLLNGDTTFNLNYTKVSIPHDLMVAKHAHDLFAYMAKQVEAFFKREHPGEYEAATRFWAPTQPRKPIQLGFTFSFPVKQLAIDSGLLIRWTKGFDIPDAIGQDVCALLQTELDRLRMPIRVAALVNDAVGTLMARSYTSHGDTTSLLGAIFGTGTNGAYVEKVSNVAKGIDGEYDTSTGDMIINTEWGSFDNQLGVLPSTAWDELLDRGSVKPGIQMFEKRVSGMFLGEIARLAMADMARDDRVSLFRDANSSYNDWQSTTTISPRSGLWKPWGLDTALLSVAASDNTPELSTLRLELENLLSVYTPSLEDAQAFKAIAGAVGRRAARLSAVAIGAVVLRSRRLEDPSVDVVDVGVDGSLVEHYPYFRDMIYEALRVIEGIGAVGAERIRIGIAKDGSGVGAALIALVAERKGKHLGQAAKRVKIREEISPLNLSFMIGVMGSIMLGTYWWSRRQ